MPPDFRHSAQEATADRSVAGPRVVHVIDSLVVGGAERLLLRFIANSGPDESRVIVMSRKGSVFEKEAIASNVPVCVLSKDRFKSPITWISAYRALRETQGDVVHMHLQYSTIIFLPLARLLGMKTVVSLHSPNRKTERWSQRVLNRIERLFLSRWADSIIGVGPLVTAAWKTKLPGLELQTIANAVKLPDLSACRPRNAVRAEIGTSSDAMVFACVASLSAQKNVTALIDAFELARRDLDEAELWLIGDGSLRGTLEQRARDAGVADVVRFLGVRADVDDLLAACDIFVLSSKWEGLPVAMLEAMAHAVPVVVPNVGDIGTVAMKSNAVLVEPGDVDALAEAMSRLGHDPQQRRSLGEAARNTIEAGYGETAWLAKLRNVYRNLAR